MNQLITYYNEILKSVHCLGLASGDVYQLPPNVTMADSWEPTESIKPVMVEVGGVSRTLVLPLAKLLRDGNWDEIVAFHPAAESIFLGQSEVLNTLTSLASIRLHLVVQQAIAAIIQLALDKSCHGKLTLKQMELLAKFPHITDTAAKYFESIVMRNTGIAGKYPLLYLRLDRGKEINGVKYSRVCTLMTPLLDAPDPMCGIVSSSKRSQLTIREIFEYVLPEVRTAGSNSNDMPYLFSLLECYYTVATYLNNINSILGKYNSGMHVIPLDWYSGLNGLPRLAKKYLPQPLPGNMGINVGGEAKTELAPATAPISTPKVVEEKPVAITEIPPATLPNGVRKGLVNPRDAIQQGVSGALPPPPEVPLPMSVIPALQHQLNIHQPVFQPPMAQPMIPVDNLSPESRINQFFNQQYVAQAAMYPPVNYTPGLTYNTGQQFGLNRPMTRGDVVGRINR